MFEQIVYRPPCQYKSTFNVLLYRYFLISLVQRKQNKQTNKQKNERTKKQAKNKTMEYNCTTTNRVIRKEEVPYSRSQMAPGRRILMYRRLRSTVANKDSLVDCQFISTGPYLYDTLVHREPKRYISYIIIII